MYLAIDLGSTHFKAALLDATLARAGEGSCRVDHVFGADGSVELDVSAAELALNRAVRDALRSATAHDLKAVAVTSQAQTFTVADASGRPRSRFISWQDGRSGPAAEALSRGMPDFGEHAGFGCPVPGLQICSLKHFRDAAPGWLSPSERVMCLPTYIVHEWTGGFVIDENLAAMTGLYSLRDRAWRSEAVAACGVRDTQLAEVVAMGGVAGHTGSDAGAYGLPEGLPVILAGNDQTAGAYAAEVHQSDALLVTLGTAQVAYVCTRGLPPSRPDTIRGPYPGGRFYRMAADSNGGSRVNWACEFLGGCGGYEEFFSRAEQSPAGANGLGFYAELPTSAGRWVNIELRHTSPDFARSIIETLVDHMAKLVRDIGAEAEGKPLLVAGGGSRSRFWVGLLAERLGAEAFKVDADPLLGAARLARDVVGGA